MTAKSIQFAGRAKLQRAVFAILQDREWHCRGCSFTDVPSGQLAGGGGIQGLQRGTRSRPGLEIESRRVACDTCRVSTVWDRWTGATVEPVCAPPLSRSLIDRILRLYGYNDVIENSPRLAGALVIDHRFPMIRWDRPEEKTPAHASDDHLRRKFQLLKKDAGGNHNLLKSRACENCFATGDRGQPFGIAWYYSGSDRWPDGVPDTGPDAESGCFGCGWYDFDAWRNGLNAAMMSTVRHGDLVGADDSQATVDTPLGRTSTWDEDRHNSPPSL